MKRLGKIRIWIPLVVACAAIGFSIANYRMYQHSVQLQEQQYQQLIVQYSEITKPHTLHEEIDNKLDRLDRNIQQLKQKAHLEEGTAYSSSLEEIFNEIDNKLLEANMLWNENQYEEANIRIDEAYEYISQLSGIRTVKIITSGETPPVYVVTFNGETIETVEVSLGWLLIDLVIPEGTVILGRNNEPLRSVEFIVNEEPPLSENLSIIGNAYHFEPDGAKFSQPVIVMWGYEQGDIPQDVNEAELYIGYWESDSERWVPLESEVDIRRNIVSAEVTHFSTFAVLWGAKAFVWPSWIINLWWGLGILGAIFLGYFFGRRRAYHY